MPLPAPLFRGSAITVALDPKNFLIIKPVAPNDFRSLHGTAWLYLPVARLASVEAEDGALLFVGDFHQVDRPSRVRLAPVGAADAAAVVDVLRARHGIPREPWRCPLADLERLREERFVIIEGTYREGHNEAPNFSGVRLTADRYALGTIASLENDRRYQVVAFYEPPPRNDYFEDPIRRLPIVGYAGAHLHATSVRELPA